MMTTSFESEPERTDPSTQALPENPTAQEMKTWNKEKVDILKNFQQRMRRRWSLLGSRCPIRVVRFASGNRDPKKLALHTFSISTRRINMALGTLTSWFSSPPRAPSTIPSTLPQTAVLQQPRTILITMGHCTFTVKNGSICSCTSGSCTSTSGTNTTEERCEDCDHLMSMHRDYGKSITFIETC